MGFMTKMTMMTMMVEEDSDGGKCILMWIIQKLDASQENMKMMTPGGGVP